MKTLNLEIESHFCPKVAAKGESLTEFTAQLTVDPFQQGGASHPLEGKPFQLVKGNCGIKVPFKGHNGLMSHFTPFRRPNSYPFFGLFSSFSLINGTRFLQDLPPLLSMIIPFEFGSTLVPHILELVEDAPLINHTLCIHQFHGSAQTTTSVTDDGLKPILGLGPSLDESMKQHFPLFMLLALGNLPIHNFSFFFPILCPESQCHQDHPLFAMAGVSCTIASIKYHNFALLGNRDPNAVQLNDLRDLLEGLGMELVDQRLKVIDPLVDCSQPDRMANGGTPAVTDVTQALTTPATP
jgi:hypothetical protein